MLTTGEGADELFAGYSYLHGSEFADPEALHGELVRSLEQLHHLNLQRCDRTTMYAGGLGQPNSPARMPPRKERHSARVIVSTGPEGFLESRRATSSPSPTTSTQSP